MKRFSIVIVCAMMLLSFTSCHFNSSAGDSGEETSISTPSVSQEDINAAKEEADRYRDMLLEKQPSILSFTYTGNDTAEDNVFTFECQLEYENGTSTGTITVYKNSDGTFSAQGLEFNT